MAFKKRKCSLSPADSLGSHGLQPARLLSPGNFPGKNTRVGYISCSNMHAHLHICAYFIYYYFTPPILLFQSIPTGFSLAFFLFHNDIFLVHCVKNDFQQHPGSQQHQHIYLLLNLTIKLIPCQNHFAYTVDKRTTKSLGFVCNFFLTTSSCPELRVVRYCK